MQGRRMVAGAIVVGHAVKHLYNSGQSSLIMPEISRDLDLTRAQFGALGSVGQIAWWSATMTAGYLGDRFSNRAGLMIAISMTLMGGGMMLAGFAPHLCHDAGCHVPGRCRPGDVPPAGVR